MWSLTLACSTNTQHCVHYCMRRSDETADACKDNKCDESYQFQCAYGACIFQSLRCNGWSECVDHRCVHVCRWTGCVYCVVARIQFCLLLRDCAPVLINIFENLPFVIFFIFNVFYRLVRITGVQFHAFNVVYLLFILVWSFVLTCLCDVWLDCGMRRCEICAGVSIGPFPEAIILSFTANTR